MSDAPKGSMVEHATRHPEDTDTHVHRINTEDNPAAGPDPLPPAPIPDEPQQPRPYRMLETGFHNGVLKKAGEIVLLLAHEVGPHHEPCEPEPEPEQIAEKPDATEAAAELLAAAPKAAHTEAETEKPAARHHNPKAKDHK